jgi:hypothetical protein
MCDYSLHNVLSRPAKVGDKLVTTSFPNALTRGFASVEEPDVAICLLPGTEIAFDDDVEYDRFMPLLANRRVGATVAQFRKIHENSPSTHHDALEFPGGKTVLLNQLIEGQRATVLQLPADPVRPKSAIEPPVEDSRVA